MREQTTVTMGSDEKMSAPIHTNIHRSSVRHRLRASHLFVAAILMGLATCAASASKLRSTEPLIVCRKILDLANAGELANSINQKNTNEVIPFPPSGDLSGSTITFSDVIDINNDGKAEYLYILGSYVDAAFVIYSHDFKHIDVPNIDEPDPALTVLGDATQVATFNHDSKNYLLGLNDNKLVYAAMVKPNNYLNVICQFGSLHDDKKQPHSDESSPNYFLLNELDIIVRDAARSNYTPWQYAFSQEKMDVAEVLISHGYSVDDVVDPDSKMPLLSWAIWQEKKIAVSWLLAHNVNVDSNRLLKIPPSKPA
jgi:hypothetical protein